LGEKQEEEATVLCVVMSGDVDLGDFFDESSSFVFVFVVAIFFFLLLVGVFNKAISSFLVF